MFRRLIFVAIALLFVILAFQAQPPHAHKAPRVERMEAQAAVISPSHAESLPELNAVLPSDSSAAAVLNDTRTAPLSQASFSLPSPLIISTVLRI